MCNLINTHTHTHTHTQTHQSGECGTPCRETPRRRNQADGKQISVSFPATYSLLPLAMLTCGEVGADVHAPIKALASRRVEHWSETHSNECQHLADGTEIARVRRRFSFLLQQALSFHTLHHLCIRGWALASTQQFRSQGPVSVHAHRTERVTGSKGGESANGVGRCIGVGGGHGDGNGVGRGNGDVNGDGDGDRVEAGTKMGTGG